MRRSSVGLAAESQSAGRLETPAPIACSAAYGWRAEADSSLFVVSTECLTGETAGSFGAFERS